MAQSLAGAVARHATRLHPSNTALFLCDIQERFRPHIHKFDVMLETAKKMVQVSKILEVPLIVTEQNPKALGPTVEELQVKDLAKIIQPKTKFSMWLPEVETVIKSHPGGINNAILFGIESHVCVLQTALDLMENGVHVVVLADGVSSINKGEIPVALQRMRDAGATVESSESVIFQLLGDAGHPRFKEIQNLVKQTKTSTVAALEAIASL
ncbi:Isochorismatase domain-containing protein 1 [Cladochytrium tenue]|nr:Isochorismatase domain-containing protein 1 [Cladochytrium tenue]